MPQPANVDTGPFAVPKTPSGNRSIRKRTPTTPATPSASTSAAAKDTTSEQDAEEYRERMSEVAAYFTEKDKEKEKEKEKGKGKESKGSDDDAASTSSTPSTRNTRASAKKQKK